MIFSIFWRSAALSGYVLDCIQTSLPNHYVGSETSNCLFLLLDKFVDR